MAFFFHYLDFGQVLITPFGEVALPELGKKPERLAFMVYKEPD